MIGSTPCAVRRPGAVLLVLAFSFIVTSSAIASRDQSWTAHLSQTKRFTITLRPHAPFLTHWMTLQAGTAVRVQLKSPPSVKPGLDLNAVWLADAREARSWPSAAEIGQNSPCGPIARKALAGTPDPLYTYLNTDPPVGPATVGLDYMGGPSFLFGSMDLYGAAGDEKFFISEGDYKRNPQLGDWFTYIAPTTGRYALAIEVAAWDSARHSAFMTVTIQTRNLPQTSGSFANGGLSAPFPFLGGNWPRVCAQQTAWLFSGGFFRPGPLYRLTGTSDRPPAGLLKPGRSQLKNLQAIGGYFCSNTA